MSAIKLRPSGVTIEQWTGHDLPALLRDSAHGSKAPTRIFDAQGRADSDVLPDWLRSEPLS
ncbi:MAG: hypothetical protein ABIV50_05220 [Opitutus sp.]